MKAAVLHEVGQPLAVEDVELDGPREGEVRFRVQASGLCHSDYHLMQGHNPVLAPAVLGHEAAGIVESVGEGVNDLRPGDLVVSSFSSFCGECPDCQTGHTHRCEEKPAGPERTAGSRLTWKGSPLFQLAGIAGFAEEVVAHRRAVVKLPSELPAECAALLGCAVLTGVGAALNGAKVQPGSSVVVIGCGGVGLNVIQGARLAGAIRIIAVDMNPSKLELARRFGATDAVLAGDDAVDEVIEKTRGGADYALEVIGLPATMRQAFLMLRKGGTAALVGMSKSDAELTLPMAPLMFKEIRIVGTLMGSSPFQLLLPKLAEFYLEGRLLLDELVSHRISLGEINEGFERMAAGAAARNVVVF